MAWTAGIGPWLCGGCGQLHGWDCPYFPWGTMTKSARAAAIRKMDADRKAGRWPFKPNPKRKAPR